ncbi:hypothetical protein DQP58_15005 [Mycobacterium colombiense]|uniref:Uncharacterized protein n=1 Tax=Mycobacterium colombiense TaxID=339268 RepID=A0A329KCY2_9MYCO|nr:hypothetical protein DQP58_15005 [Mycobacterium colombiense]
MPTKSRRPQARTFSLRSVIPAPCRCDQCDRGLTGIYRVSPSNVDWDANASRFGITFRLRNFATRHQRAATGPAYPLSDRPTPRVGKRQAAANL